MNPINTHSKIPTYFVSGYEENLFLTRYQDPTSDSDKESTWEDVFDRVSTTVAKFSSPRCDLRFPAESTYLSKMFFDMMANGEVIPSSPQLWNYGSSRKYNRSGASCFTGKLGDSLADFNETNADAECTYIASGGFGVSGNEVRPTGCKIEYAVSNSIGVMGTGGPIERIERTTGYITNGGRERGAMMVQLAAWHPDAIRFILAKKPTSLGFIDDWRENARSIMKREGFTKQMTVAGNMVIDRFYSDYVFNKEWPLHGEVIADIYELFDCGSDIINALECAGILRTGADRRLIPQVHEFETDVIRTANKDWSLPLQNCNMSVQIPDSMITAAERDESWVFSWFSKEMPKAGRNPWTKTDCMGDLRVYDNGETFDVTNSRTAAISVDSHEHQFEIAPNGGNYRYAVIITTWDGLRENLAPNPNNWKDTEYARFYRNVILPEIERYGHGQIKARQVIDLIFRSARDWADPGVTFEDTYERFNPVDSAVYGKRISNPCAEFVCPPGGSCNLVSLNLRYCAEQTSVDFHESVSRHFPHDSYWEDSGMSTEEDWNILRDTPEFNIYLENVRTAAAKAAIYGNNALEYNVVPVEYINRLSSEDFRTIGVGIMGLAEALITFHVKYGSECGTAFAAATMSEVAITAWEVSFQLAMQQSWPKPKGWNPERMIKIFGLRTKFGSKHKLSKNQIERWDALVHRVQNGEYATNTCVTSIAPTGTIAQIAGWQMSRAAANGHLTEKLVTSSGEPPFSWFTHRKDNSGSTIVNHDLWMMPEHHAKPWMQTSSDVSPEWHVRIQAAVCDFCCMSMSKTINLAEHATVKDVSGAYLLAHKLGIPGTAVYRNNSRPMQVLTALKCPGGECEVDLGAAVDAPKVSELYGK